MFVDTTALREQVIDDVIVSAFGSAGQRCSALRLLFLPARHRRRADRGPGGRHGRPGGRRSRPIRATDIGPVIDEDARRPRWRRTCERLEPRGQGAARAWPTPAGGHLLRPGAGGDPARPTSCDREVFGPILHVVRYDAGRAGRGRRAPWPPTGYGLTLGVHSRIEGFADEVRAAGPGRQRLRQPLDHRRGGGRAAVRRRGPLRHRPQGRRPPRPDCATPWSARSASTSPPRAATRRC